VGITARCHLHTRRRKSLKSPWQCLLKAYRHSCFNH
jgi:hypothetical protein